MDKPPRTFWQIWNMSFGFLGIRFGWGLQMANMFGSTTAEITAGELRITIPSRTLAVFDVVGNHDMVRSYTRYGDGVHNDQIAKLMAAFYRFSEQQRR